MSGATRREPVHPSEQPTVYPLGLLLAGRRVVVVGGGPVAARRARGVLEAGADVVLVAPDACEDVHDLVAQAAGRSDPTDDTGSTGSTGSTNGALRWVRREYLTGDLDGAWLVHTATGDRATDARVAADAEASRTLCVVASDAEASSAWVPAVARGLGEDADLVVAVNAGADPRRAVAVRDAVSAGLATGDLPVRRHRRQPHGTTGRTVTSTGSTGSTGTVALVGGGPGSLDLLTTRGRRLVAQADVLVIDRLAPRAILEELGDDVVVIDVGKTSGHHPVPQDEINRLLVEHALAGATVVRLKGGDPYVFGRGGEEAEACRAAGVPVEVVPGVTSAISVPAAAGIPVTHRGLARGFSVVTGHEELGAVPTGADHTLVLLMGVSRLADTAATLVAGGRPASTPVALVEDGFGPRQRVTVGTLGTIAARAAAVGVRPPAVTVVGDVVRLAPAWSDQAGSDQAGSDQAWSDQAWSDQAGSDQAGSDQAGSDQAGSDQAWSDQPVDRATCPDGEKPLVGAPTR